MKQETKNRSLELLKENGYTPISDLNYAIDNGIEYYIGYKGDKAGVVALIIDEDNCMICKEDLRGMALTAKIKGIETIELFTNYGLELHSRYDKPEVVGFTKITKTLSDWEPSTPPVGEGMPENAEGFTPGKWYTKWDGEDRTGIDVFSDNGEKIVSFVMGGNLAEAQANAKLIAAAPSMYEALKKCWPFIHDLEQENHSEPNVGIFKDDGLTEAFKSLQSILNSIKQ